MGFFTRLITFWLPSTSEEQVALASGQPTSGLSIFARRGTATSSGRSVRHAGAQMHEAAQSVEQLCEQMRDTLKRIDAQMDVRSRRDPQILEALDAFEQMRSQLSEWHLQHEQVHSAIEDASRLCRDTLDAQRLILTGLAQREEVAGERHDELVMALRRLEMILTMRKDSTDPPAALLPAGIDARPAPSQIDELSIQLARSTRLVATIAIGALVLGAGAIALALTL
ncbi:MAG: hypothetical protein ACYTF7_09840 [Planctomycetota bacterium]|jgi:hypothetical protein